MCFLFYFHLLRFFFISFLLTQKGASLSKNGTFFKRVDRNRFKICMALTQLDKHWKAQIKLNNFDKKNYLLNYQKFTAIPLFGLNVQIYHYEDYLFQKCSIFRWQCRMHPITPTSTTFVEIVVIISTLDHIFHHLKKKKNLRKRNRTFSCAWCAVCSFR